MQGDAWTGQQLASRIHARKPVRHAMEALAGCGALPFNPAIAVQPEQPAEAGRAGEQTRAASTPTGLERGRPR